MYKCKWLCHWAIHRRRLKVVGEMRSSIGGDRQDVDRAALAWMASSPAYPKRTSVEPYNFPEPRTRKRQSLCTIQTYLV